MPRKRADRWRWHLRAALASTIAGACRLEQHARKAREQRRPLILGYHRVVDDFATASQTEMPSMLISQAMFERHLECDRQALPLRHPRRDRRARVASGEPFAEPVAAITFDDGYRDMYEHAFPILQRKGIPAAVFVVTDLIGGPLWQMHDRLYHLVDKAFPRGTTRGASCSS